MKELASRRPYRSTCVRRIITTAWCLTWNKRSRSQHNVNCDITYAHFISVYFDRSKGRPTSPAAILDPMKERINTEGHKDRICVMKPNRRYAHLSGRLVDMTSRAFSTSFSAAIQVINKSCIYKGNHSLNKKLSEKKKRRINLHFVLWRNVRVNYTIVLFGGMVAFR